jgi:hypothetical protein
MENGDFKTCLLAAKHRIALTQQLSIPRLELCRAVLGARSRGKIVHEVPYEFESIYHTVDSMIVIAHI